MGLRFVGAVAGGGDDAAVSFAQVDVVEAGGGGEA